MFFTHTPSPHTLSLSSFMRQVSVMTKIYQLNLLVVVQSKHSVVVAGNKRQFQNELFEKWSWGEKDLTKDAGKGWPVWGVEGAIGLTCCQDKRGRKPVVVKNLLIQSTVAIENISIVLELLLLNTCPSGQMNVKLKPTFGAGCKSKRYQIWCTVHSHPTIFNCPKQGSGWPEIFLGLRSKTNAVVLICLFGLDFVTYEQISVHCKFLSPFSPNPM